MSNDIRKQLIADVAREIAEFQSASDLVDEAASTRLGINRTDQRCMGILFTQGTMSAGQLAQASGLSPGATTTAIDRLEKAGYARRGRDAGDRRAVMVELTEQARRLVDDIYGPIGRAGMERLQRYTDEQLLFLLEFLREGEALQVEYAAALRSAGPSSEIGAARSNAAISPNPEDTMQIETPILVAHRGGSLEAPENTMASFRHAIEIGMRFVELDVQMTRDGALVVLHDPTLDRTTDGTGPVGAVTLADLQKVDAGSHFSPEFAGEPVPTLREVLNLCVDAGVGVIVEIKDVHLYTGMEEKVAALLGEMSMHGAENLWCISFDHAAIRKLRTLDGALPLGYLYPPGQEEFVAPDDTVQAYCPFYQAPLARPDQVQRAHDLGKFVFVYTVNTREDMLAVAQAGVDGMVSDRPSLLRSTFNR